MSNKKKLITGDICFRRIQWCFIPIFFLVLFNSCNDNSTTHEFANKIIKISNFCATSNYQPNQKDIKQIELDYSNAIQGFVIPSNNQIKEGYFKVRFNLQNISNEAQQLYYKIYYSNVSYKFQEYDSILKADNPLAVENFYGSWEDTKVEFKKIKNKLQVNEEIEVNDEIRIVGNPRNEERYFENGINNRWKRNPRVGMYTFVIVVCTEADLNTIPPTIKNISKKNQDKFDNPFYYFKYAEGAKLKQTIVHEDPVPLKVVATPPPANGIYIDNSTLGTDNYDKSNYCSTCGEDEVLYRNAAFQQFINYVDESTKFYNIPVVADIINDNYSMIEYNWTKSFYTREELIPTLIQTSKHPCQTVFSDTVNNKITIKNPGSKPGQWKKESVGVITRHGMTYGKYRVKVKLTELLNKEGVWNGLTNAIWLITQGGGEWNYRRNCNSRGYMATYWGGVNDKRVPAVDYTEIDFEIIKTPPYCPSNVFPPIFLKTKADKNDLKNWNVQLPEELIKSKDKVTVACTNWDMACMEPKNFSTGCNTIEYQGQTFNTFRWDSVYRALTERTEELDDELFKGDYYYFEIDWRPKEIIWRIGKSPDNMRIVGYMNDKVTSIPNNQMLLIITQEYHNTIWWPGAPFAQENLPFPLNDIPGEIYELHIE